MNGIKYDLLSMMACEQEQLDLGSWDLCSQALHLFLRLVEQAMPSGRNRFGGLHVHSAITRAIGDMHDAQSVCQPWGNA